jgi:hypothetical protein
MDGGRAALLLALPAAVVGQDNEAVSIDDLSLRGALQRNGRLRRQKAAKRLALMSYRFLQFMS